MEHTENFQLSQWEAADRIQMQDFNADNAKIDAALAAQAAVLALKGNCRVEARSYTGATQDGSGLTHSITFSKRPAFVLIFGGSSLLFVSGLANSHMALYVGGHANLSGHSISLTDGSWNGNILRLTSSYKECRMDAANVPYHLFAWTPMDAE